MEKSVDPKSSAATAIQEKWGYAALDAGWTTVPNALLKYAGALDLDPTETLVLIYLMRFWWKTSDLPYPSISRTSIEMGVSRKTMTKKFASLREKGFIKLVKQGGKNKFSLEGLQKALTAEHMKQLDLPKAEKDAAGDDDIPF